MVTLRVSIKNTLTVESKRATATKRLLGLMRTQSTSSSNLSIRELLKLSRFLFQIDDMSKEYWNHQNGIKQSSRLLCLEFFIVNQFKVPKSHRFVCTTTNKTTLKTY
jgi:hypothetical protein